MLSYVKQEPDCLALKYPCDTPWSARVDATEAVFRGYKQFQSTLQEIAIDDKHTEDTGIRQTLLQSQWIPKK